MIDDDRADYFDRLIAHRCPEIGPADLASAEAASQPAPSDDMVVPVEVLDQVLDVVIALEERMNALEATLGVGADPVDACRRALIDLRVEDKRLALIEVDKWVSLEEAGTETRQ